MFNASKQVFFVQGKGGTGKTTYSRALAQAFAKKGAQTAWVELDGPGDSPSLSNVTCLNLEPHAAFEEYVGLKLKIPRITSLFLNNSLIRSLVRAAPGVHELVLLGKIWHERNHFEKIIVDMPSTGFGMTMFQATKNFAKMLRGSPVEKDALGMLETFGDPGTTEHVIVSLPEEMPLREAVELEQMLQKAFPKIQPSHVVNKLFPAPSSATPDSSAKAFADNRHQLEIENLKILSDRPYTPIPFLIDIAQVEQWVWN